MKKKVVFSTVGVLVLVGAGFVILNGSKDSDDKALPRIKVMKGNIVDKALAVGRLSLRTKSPSSQRSQVLWRGFTLMPEHT